MKRIIITLVILLSFVFSAKAQMQYEIIDLGTLGGDQSEAQAINDNGQIVGWAYLSGNSLGHAFIYESGAMTDLGALNSPSIESSWAYDINNIGQTIGRSTTTGGGDWHVFLHEGGSMTDLGFPTDQSFSRYAINNAGQIVGDENQKAFLYDNGVKTYLGNLAGISSEPSWAYDINDIGQIVGFSGTNTQSNHAFLYESGIMTDLGTLGLNSRALAINNNGQVVGFSETSPGGWHGFLYESGIMYDLGSEFRYAYDINDSGQIVGHSGQYALVYDEGNIINLGTLPGHYSSRAYGINNSGQVVGYSISNTGEQRAVLWNPINVVPEPISSILFITGGTLLAGRRYLRRKI